MEESLQTEMVETGEKDYARLIAAQNEAERRLKIKTVSNKIEANKKSICVHAVATGVFVSGVVASAVLSGFDVNQAIATELQALNSFSALKDYFAMITPAMLATMTMSVIEGANWAKACRNLKNNSRELHDMQNYVPTAFQDEVEKQARVI